MKKYLSASLVVAILGLSACATPQSNMDVTVAPDKETKDELVIVQQSFNNLPNWNLENFNNFAMAYERSCNRILKKNSQSNFAKDVRFGKNQEWQIACRKFNQVDKNNTNAVRDFFETNFI